MSMPWFRMYAEWSSDPVVQSLAFEDQRHHAILLCLKCNGTLDRNIADTHRERIIFRGLGLDPTTAAEAKRRLMEVGLIDEKWQPSGWEKRQYTSSISTDRVRKYRNNKENGNVPVTVNETTGNSFGNAPDTDTDTDTKRKLHTQEQVPAADGGPKEKRQPCPKDEIIAMYHSMLPMCPRVLKWTDTRDRLLKSRWAEHTHIDLWTQYFSIVKKSRFLTGKTNGSADRKPFLADFEWLIRPGNFVKVLEGKYDDNRS